MSLPDGFTDIPPGKIAAIATILERRDKPAASGITIEGRPDWRFERVKAPEHDWYVDLLRRVGSNHLWYQRLITGPEAIAAKITASTTIIHALFVDGMAEGIAELDLSEEGSAELVYFGVTPTLAGSGAAHVMMERLVADAFSRPVDRLWLHTNTIDHPRAMAFYRRAGFTPVRQMLELADDPRLMGLFAEDAAPQVPLFPVSEER